MPGFIGKAHDLIFNRGAVACANAFDDARIHGGLIYRTTDNVVGGFGGIGDMAGPLRQGRRPRRGAEGKKVDRIITVLGGQIGIVDGIAVNAGHSTGFHAAHAKILGLEPLGQGGRGKIAQTAGGKILQPHMHQTIQKGASGHNHGPDPQHLIQRGAYAPNPAIFHQNFIHHGLMHCQAGLIFQNLLHAQAVQKPVGLGPGRAHRWPLAGIETPELDGSGIDIFRHFSAKGVYFPHQMPLGQTANGGIAAHGADGVGIDDTDQGAAAQTGRSQGRLATRMARADNGNIKIQHNFYVEEENIRIAQEVSQYLVSQYLQGQPLYGQAPWPARSKARKAESWPSWQRMGLASTGITS